MKCVEYERDGGKEGVKKWTIKILYTRTSRKGAAKLHKIGREVDLSWNGYRFSIALQRRLSSQPAT